MRGRASEPCAWWNQASPTSEGHAGSARVAASCQAPGVGAKAVSHALECACCAGSEPNRACRAEWKGEASIAYVGIWDVRAPGVIRDCTE